MSDGLRAVDMHCRSGGLHREAGLLSLDDMAGPLLAFDKHVTLPASSLHPSTITTVSHTLLLSPAFVSLWLSVCMS